MQSLLHGDGQLFYHEELTPTLTARRAATGKFRTYVNQRLSDMCMCRWYVQATVQSRPTAMCLTYGSVQLQRLRFSHWRTARRDWTCCSAAIEVRNGKTISRTVYAVGTSGASAVTTSEDT